MRPSINEARYNAAHDLLLEETDLSREEIDSRIEERAEEIRNPY